MKPQSFSLHAMVSIALALTGLLAAAAPVAADHGGPHGCTLVVPDIHYTWPPSVPAIKGGGLECQPNQPDGGSSP